MRNNKVLVEVTVPAAGEKYDVFIPLDCRMSDVLIMVSTALAELTQGKYQPSDDAVLCEKSTGIIYNVNMGIAELGIRNGAKLMLI